METDIPSLAVRSYCQCDIWLTLSLFSLGALRVLGDLWSYSILSGQWTWRTGYNTATLNHYSIFGPYATFGADGAPGTVIGPGGRTSHAMPVDWFGNLWVIGGLGYDDTTNNVFLNDVWRYAASTNSWAFMHGNRTAGDGGNYGSIGEASVVNRIPARSQHAATFDAANNLLVHGGTQSTAYDDLWQLLTGMTVLCVAF